MSRRLRTTSNSKPSGDRPGRRRRTYELRRLARERRARERWHTIGLGSLGAGVARLNTPAHEQPSAIGAHGEERVAVCLEKLLEDTGVVLLHDRRIPSTRANIDHIAVGPGGVTVTDAKHYKGKARTETRGVYASEERAPADRRARPDEAG